MSRFENSNFNQIGSLLGLNTNSTTFTVTNGNITQIVEKDSSNNVVKTTTLNYDSNNQLITVSDVFNGKTVTYTFTRDISGNLQTITKTLV